MHTGFALVGTISSKDNDPKYKYHKLAPYKKTAEIIIDKIKYLKLVLWFNIKKQIAIVYNSIPRYRINKLFEDAIIIKENNNPSIIGNVSRFLKCGTKIKRREKAEIKRSFE
jgi:hypothetical protein